MLVPLLSIVIQMLIGLLRLQRSNILKGLPVIAILPPTFTDWVTFLEVQIMRGTNHPAIVRLLSFSESPEHYFIVLERA